jgi:hypothetical protein
MSDEQQVIEKLIEHGILEDEEQRVRGIAQLALDQGYDKLSPLQQGVLKPFLSQACDGVENPGGHHNDCPVVLDGRQLAEALSQQAYYGSLLCQDCVSEKEQYANEWARIQAE